MRQVTDGKVGDRLNVDAGGRAARSPRTVVVAAAVAASLSASTTRCSTTPCAWRARRATGPGVAAGAGPRGGISLVRAARAAALLAGRDFVTPDDVKRMALPALRHRVAPSPELELEGRDADAMLKDLLEKIEAPRQ